MQRERDIDLIKGVLTIFMIMAHVIQFFGTPDHLSRIISNYANLTTFSGFFFVFGYVNYLAYFRKENVKQSKQKITKNAIHILIIYYISALASRMLVSRNLFAGGIRGLINVLILSDVPWYCEFLLSFFLVAVFSYLFFTFLKNMQNLTALIVIVFCLLFTFVPLQWVKITQVGLIVGSYQFYAFPLVQYLPYFLLGILFAKNRYSFKISHLLIASLCTLLYYLYTVTVTPEEHRFPPDLFWILGAALFLYLYLIISRFILKKADSWPVRFVEGLGQSTLYYLILSNIFVFALSTQWNRQFHFLRCTLLTSVIIFSVYSIKKIVR